MKSDFFGHALEANLDRERRREALARYLQGYPKQPETDDEIVSAEALSRLVAFGAEPWE